MTCPICGGTVPENAVARLRVGRDWMSMCAGCFLRANAEAITRAIGTFKAAKRKARKAIG